MTYTEQFETIRHNIAFFNPSKALSILSCNSIYELISIYNAKIDDTYFSIPSESNPVQIISRFRDLGWLTNYYVPGNPKLSAK